MRGAVLLDSEGVICCTVSAHHTVHIHLFFFFELYWKCTRHTFYSGLLTSGLYTDLWSGDLWSHPMHCRKMKHVCILPHRITPHFKWHQHWGVSGEHRKQLFTMWPCRNLCFSGPEKHRSLHRVWMSPKSFKKMGNAILFTSLQCCELLLSLPYQPVVELILTQNEQSP